ncbi:MAG: hypothetical protein U0X75_01735 [Acidobacteriota bacterium]
MHQNTSKFNQLAVRRFKATVNNSRLIDNGQFYWSGLMREALESCGLTLLKNAKCEPLHKNQAMEASVEAAKQMYVQLWARYEKGEVPNNSDQMIDFFLTSNFPFNQEQADMLKQVEKDRCFEVAGRVCRIIARKGGLLGKKAGQKFPNLCVTSDAKTLLKKLPPLCLKPEKRCKADTVSRGTGTVLSYRPLEKELDSLVNALNDGYLIKTGVLSGTCNEQRKPETPDHFIIIIGHDRGRRFIFWDPDADASCTTIFGAGFGFLHFASNRLTTAKDEEDLVVSICSPGIPGDGDHVTNCRRLGGNRVCQHRYQVMTLESVPSKCRKK